MTRPGDEVGDDAGPLGADGVEAFPVDGDLILAPVWKRALARLIDVFLIFNVAGLLTVALVRPREGDTGTVSFLVVETVFLVIAGVYEAGMVAWRGQTLAKMLLHIRVARRSDLANPTPAEAVVRFAVPAVWLYLTVVLPLVGEALWVVVFLSAIPNPRRQGWHDRAAATLVLSSR